MNLEIFIVGMIMLVFIGMSIPLLMGKASWLIAGYNTSSKAQKEGYDEKKLCRATAVLLLMIVFLLLLQLLHILSAMVFSILTFLLIPCFMLYANIACKRR